MVGRVPKVLGGIGAALAVVAAGAGGVTWFTAEKATIDSAKVLPQTPTPTASPSGAANQLSMPTPSASLGADGLTLDAIPPAKMMISFEKWVVKAGANDLEFPVEKVPLASLSCLRKDFATIKDHEDCLGSRKGCTPAQRSWLEKNAVLAKEALFAIDGKLGLGKVTLANTSKSAQSLSFKNLRWEGKVSPVENAGYAITCTNFNDWAGGASAGFANTRQVLLPSEAGTGIFGGPPLYGEDLTRNVPAGMPAVFNLGAGETSGAYLELKVAHKVATLSGRVLATVAASDGEKEVQVPVPLLDSGVAVYTSVPMPVLAVDGGAVCPKDQVNGKKYLALSNPCSVQQLKAENNLG